MLLNCGLLRSLGHKAKISRTLGHMPKHFGHIPFPQHGRYLCIITALCICGSTTVKCQASRSPGCASGRKARKGSGCHQLGGVGVWTVPGLSPGLQGHLVTDREGRVGWPCGGDGLGWEAPRFPCKTAPSRGQLRARNEHFQRTVCETP